MGHGLTENSDEDRFSSALTTVETNNFQKDLAHGRHRADKYAPRPVHDALNQFSPSALAGTSSTQEKCDE